MLCGGDDRTVREERVVDTAVIDTCNGKAALTVGDLLETEAVKLRLFAEVNHGIPDIIAFCAGIGKQGKEKIALFGIRFFTDTGNTVKACRFGKIGESLCRFAVRIDGTNRLCIVAKGNFGNQKFEIFRTYRHVEIPVFVR